MTWFLSPLQPNPGALCSSPHLKATAVSTEYRLLGMLFPQFFKRIVPAPASCLSSNLLLREAFPNNLLLQLCPTHHHLIFIISPYFLQGYYHFL